MRPLSKKRREPVFHSPEVEVARGPGGKVERRRTPLKLLMDLRPEAQKRRPGPSKTVYRIQRIWRKTWVRRLTFTVLPIGLIGAVVWQAVHHPGVRQAYEAQRAAMMDALSDRPEFAVRGVRIRGASPSLTDAVRDVARLQPGTSSLDLDVVGMQTRIAAMGGVRRVEVALGSDGIVDVAIVERMPEALWRDEEDVLWLMGRDGVAVAEAEGRSRYPQLPLVLGEGGDLSMEEALAVFRAAPDLRGRIRALVRVGERRWNLVLDRGLTIMLPEDAATKALERVMAWHFGEDLLDRGLAAVDMRNAERPTLRMLPSAHKQYQDDLIAVSDGEET